MNGSNKHTKNWKEILKVAITIMDKYDTGVTLRQLFYRLVSIELIENTRSMYTSLSKKTATARREGWFPSFIDKTRQIESYQTFDSPGQAKKWLSRVYRRDRTEGQKYHIYLGVEKAGIVEQLKSWFGDYGISVIALKGYSSQTYVDDVTQDIKADGRPAILIYAGDFDPSGEDILRDFKKRCPVFDQVIPIALTQDQVIQYQLPEMMGKSTDKRAKGFIEKYGKLVQVELDALEPSVLKELYRNTLFGLFDMSTYYDSCDKEDKDIKELIA